MCGGRSHPDRKTSFARSVCLSVEVRSMMAVLVLFLVCVWCAGATAADVATCSEGGPEASLALSRQEALAGRYVAQWCTTVEAKAAGWGLLVWTRRGACAPEPGPAALRYRPGVLHSRYEQDVVFEGNCSYVCLNTTVDLVFSSCYLLKSYFTENNHLRRITQQFVPVHNNYTKELFANNSARVEVLPTSAYEEGQNVTLVWHTGVPFTHFQDVLLWTYDNTTMRKQYVEPQYLNCWSPSETEVRCSARLAAGSYHSRLQLHAPWEHGLFHEQGVVTYSFVVRVPEPAAVSGAGPAWLWPLAGALLAAAGAAVCALRRRDARALHKRVLRDWLVHRSESSPAEEAGAPAAAPRRHILLLYAREGPRGARLTAELAAMLQATPNTQVYDIFSAEVMAQAAGAPGAWVRGMAARPDVAVLLLQTPALAALYRRPPPPGDAAPTLQAPLLGSRVLYRAPQYGDALLQFALALAAEDAHAPADYRKYYVATLSELPTEVLPWLVPYRRYELPGGAALLSRDLCAAPAEPALAALDLAAQEFVQHARDHPDYLMDELMLM